MTAASSAIERAEALGAAFELKDGSVKIRAPRPLPSDLMAELREHKAQVIDHLRRRQAQGEPISPTVEASESRGPQEPPAAGTGLSESEKRRAEFEQVRKMVAAQGAVDEPPRSPPLPDETIGRGKQFDAVRQQAAQVDTSLPDTTAVDDTSGSSPPPQALGPFAEPKGESGEGTPGALGNARQGFKDAHAPARADAQRPRVVRGETSAGRPAEPVEGTTASFDTLGQGSAGQLPPQHEPASPGEEVDTSSWHQAFERLATRRGQGQSAEPTDAAGAQRVPGARELRMSGQPSSPPPPTSEQGGMERPPQVDSPLPPATPPAPTGQPPGPGADTSEDVRRRDDFAALRRQVSEQGVAEIPSDAGLNPPDSRPSVPGITRTGPRVQDTSSGGLPPGAGEGTARPPGVVRASSAVFPAGIEDSGRPAAKGRDASELLRTPGPSPRPGRLGGGGDEAPDRLRRLLQRFPSLLHRATPGVRSQVAKAPTLRAAAERSRDIVSRLVVGPRKQVTSITIEQGSIKLLSTSGLQVLDFRMIPADPKYFRQGLVSDAPRVAARIKEALKDMTGAHRRAMGVVPGYQSTLRRLELPNAKGMDPKVMIPREARRKLGISPETSSLTWHKMATSTESTNWLVLSATNRSIASLSASVQAAGLGMVGMELKSFALARALNQQDAICAWAAEDGCDAVIVRDWTPVTHQAAYWGVGSMVETADVVNRITELLESTIVAHDMQNPEMSVSEDIPLYVTGSSVGRDRAIAQRVAANLRRPATSPDPPIALPAGFPIDHLLINVGLALWDA